MARNHRQDPTAEQWRGKSAQDQAAFWFAKPKPQPKKQWSLKLTTVLWALLGICLAAGAVYVLSSTNQCTQGVRCAD